jgi:hypothetical protein
MPLPKTVFNYPWLILGLISGLLIMAWPSSVHANGGTIVLVEQVGAYELTLTASPYPLQVGVNDVNALVERLSDQLLVLDAKVTMTIEALDQPGEPQTFSATHDTATNKLYYHANVVFPTPGRWRLTIHLDGPEDEGSATLETQVEERSSLDFLRYLSLVGLPLVVIVFLFFVMSRRGGEALKGDLEGEG